MYEFRREDNGEIIEVDFETMIEQDAGGFIQTMIDGQPVIAKRVHAEQRIAKSNPIMLAAPPPIISDLTFGCSDFQVEDFRDDARQHGFTDINFVPEQDFAETGFYQVESSSPDQWRRYVEHRGCPDKNSKNGSGAMVSAEGLERAKAIVNRAYS